MADILSVLSVAAFILGGAGLVAAAVLFFALKIPSVIGELTGRNARKKIAAIRAAEKSEAESGKNNGGISREKFIVPRKIEKDNRTKVLSDISEAEKTLPLDNSGDDDETVKLSAENGEQTEVLTADDSATEVLTADDSATEVLTADDSATEVLTDDDFATELLTDNGDESGATGSITEKLGETVGTEEQIPKLVMLERVIAVSTDEDIV
ncbi:MAG: hypothetical protein ACI4JI_03995 [Ruminiclostridium sp.]